MQFLDFSPPIIPTLDQQRDALQKGLGRAVQWASAGKLATDPLLNACLHDQRFDRQCEDNRGEWLWGIISALGVAQQLRDPILDALRKVTDERDAYQLCDLALHFAQSGDDAFRNQLHEFVQHRQISDSPEIGEGQLLRLDGEVAFRLIARLRGQHLATHEWDWDDDAVIDMAVELLGESRVQAVLTEALEPEIRRFAAGRKEKVNLPTDPESRRQAHIQKMQAIAVSEVIHAVHSEDKCYWLRGWGMNADKQALEGVLERLWAEQAPPVIVKMLRVFSNRPLPSFDSRLIALCNHLNDDVRRWAYKATEKNSNALVREFALQELREQTSDKLVVSLLIKNFEEGDEERLLDHVELPDDPCERHWMLMDVIELLEQNETAESLKLGQIVYFHTPCQNCRFYAARLLLNRRCMPTWLVEECRSDAEEDCRTLGEPKDDHDEGKNES